MKCNNCGFDLVDGGKFCPFCGEQLSDINNEKKEVEVESESKTQKKEASSESDVAKDEAFDGANTVSEAIDSSQVDNNEQKIIAENTVITDHEKLINKSKRHKKNTIIGIVASIVVLGIFATVGYFLFFNKNTSDSVAPVVYTTDTDLVIIESLGQNREKTKTIKISEDYAGYYKFSENYKYVVYTENKESHDTDYDGTDDTITFDVYCKKTFDADGEGMLIAKNVSQLDDVLGDIDKIIFDKNGDIYYSDINGNSTKIANNASFEGLTNDRKYAICAKYIEGEYDYETETTGPSSYELKFADISSGDVIKVCDSASNYWIDHSSDKFYYIKNDTLYVSDVSGEEKSIDKDVYEPRMVGDKLFYVLLDKEYTYYDFVNDSYKDSDSQITEPYWEDYAPDYDDYQKQVYDDFWDEYTTEIDYDAYDKAYEKAQEKYESDQEKYDEACDRIELREELMEYSYESYSLYCFDGSESKKITDNISLDYTLYPIPDISIIENQEEKRNDNIFAVSAESYSKPLKDLKKINITSVESSDDINSYLSDIISYKSIIANSEKVIEVPDKEKNSYFAKAYFKDNNFLLFFNSDDEDENVKSTIYSLSSKATSFDDAEVLIENVYGINWVNNNLISYLDYDEKSHTSMMVVDNQKINDVYPYGFLQQDGDDGFLYATDYDSETRESTVYYYKNGKSTKIADDVIFDSATKLDNKYLFITDFDSEDYDDGTLICIDGEKQFEIDNNVTEIDNSGFVNHNTFS